MKQSEKAVITVSQFTRDAKHLLEERFRFLWISGEVSNLRTPYSGHSYFILKDSKAQLKAVLFKQQKRFIDLRLADGQEVICFGRISVYEPLGEYQLIVDSVQLQGTGNLQLQFEKMKKELDSLGFFSPESKKQLPQYPKDICVITSPSGAAIRDFLKILSLRKFPARIRILPVRVQGDAAAGEIAEAIDTAHRLEGCELIVLCRGGGSLEDLWSFNERVVAEAIFRSTLPVVTGVGHEIDTTIADLCADLRCATPTAVAEKIFPDCFELLARIDEKRTRLIRITSEALSRKEQQIDYCIRILGDMEDVLDAYYYKVQARQLALTQNMIGRLQQAEHKLGDIQSRLSRQAPVARIAQQYGEVKTMEMSLLASIRRVIAQKESDLGKLAALLDGVSPLATLARGYSITRKYSGRKSTLSVLTSAQDATPGDRVNISLAQGEIDCTVDRCIKEKEANPAD